MKNRQQCENILQFKKICLWWVHYDKLNQDSAFSHSFDIKLGGLLEILLF
jgi:hypothetical protein